MTLSPVFRSERAVRLLQERGLWDRLAPDLEAQARAVEEIHADLREVLDEGFLAGAPPLPDAARIHTPEGLRFLQEYFFLILFRSVFHELGVAHERLELYTRLNFCIKGTITAADNIFDDQDKALLPLAPLAGPRFRSILQLMCFERLLRRTLDRGEAGGVLDASQRERIQRELLGRMAEIGALEGSEEGGVKDVPTPEAMVEAVHRVRGGALFALAFTAPSVLEPEDARPRLAAAEEAISRLGTAFQIVDDLTDFEFDLGRRSHNLLVAQVEHRGTREERARLAALLEGSPLTPDVVERDFAGSAREVLEIAYREARASFEGLRELGHWVDPELATEVVHAIVGLDGVARMAALTGAE